MIRRLPVFATVLCAVLFAVLTVHAAEEGGNAAQEHANEIFKWINFVLVAAGLFWLFGKVLPPKFRGNADAISSAITKATAAKAEGSATARSARIFRSSATLAFDRPAISREYDMPTVRAAALMRTIHSARKSRLRRAATTTRQNKSAASPKGSGALFDRDT